jgi:hypothetical protein
VLVESLTDKKKRAPEIECRTVIVRTAVRIPFILWQQNSIHVQVLPDFSLRLYK